MNAPVRQIDLPDRRRLSVEDFLVLAESGSFAECGKTELIDGDIYVMNAQLTRHARVKSRLFGELLLCLRRIGSDLEAISEVSVRVADNSMPEPDIVLSRFQGDRDMPAASVALVAEIADTTLGHDLGRKAQLYAAAGIAEYWVVDVNGGLVLQHYQPESGAYARVQQVAVGTALDAATIEGLTVPTEGLGI